MSQENFDHAKVNIALQQAIAAILGNRPIAYHAVLARALGSVTAGVFVSQLLYWTPRSQDPDGWVWKTQDQILEETALGRREQETARRVLKTAGILEEKLRGVPATLHFRVKMDKLVDLISEYQSQQRRPSDNRGSFDEERNFQYGGKRQTGLAESATLVGRKAPIKNGGKRQTFNTESTAETTTKTSTENLDSNLGNLDRSSRSNSGRRPRQGRPTPTSPLATSAASANIPLGSSEHSYQTEQLSLSEPGANVEASSSDRTFSRVGQLLARRAPTLKNVHQGRSGARKAAYKIAADLEDLDTNSGLKRATGSPRRQGKGFISTPYLDKVIEEFSLLDLRDPEHVKSNQRQARNLMLAAGLDEETFVQSYIYQARSQTKAAPTAVARRGAYFFACLKSLLTASESSRGKLRKDVR